MAVFCLQLWDGYESKCLLVIPEGLDLKPLLYQQKKITSATSRELNLGLDRNPNCRCDATHNGLFCQSSSFCYTDTTCKCNPVRRATHQFTSSVSRVQLVNREPECDSTRRGDTGANLSVAFGAVCTWGWFICMGIATQICLVADLKLSFVMIVNTLHTCCNRFWSQHWTEIFTDSMRAGVSKSRPGGHSWPAHPPVVSCNYRCWYLLNLAFG